MPLDLGKGLPCRQLAVSAAGLHRLLQRCQPLTHRLKRVALGGPERLSLRTQDTKLTGLPGVLARLLL